MRGVHRLWRTVLHCERYGKRRRLAAFVCCALVIATPAFAYQWNATATVDSSTMTTNQLCYWAGKVLECSATNPTIASGQVGIGTTSFSQALTVDGNIDITGSGFGYLTEIANDGTTGTTANKLAKLTTSGAAIIGATTDTDGMVGIVTGGAGTTGNAQIAINGQASCVFDGTTTAGDFVAISTTTAGDCHDAGATRSTSSQTIGRVLTTNGSGGTYTVELGMNGNAASGSGTMNYVARWTPNGTTLGTGTMYDNGTNVGIGTTTPTGLFSVNSTATGTPYGVYSTLTGASNTGTAGYFSNTSTSGYALYANGNIGASIVSGAAAPVTGILPVGGGGTGDNTLTLNGVLYGNGTSAINTTAQGGANTVLTANNGAPSFSGTPTINTSVTVPLVIGGTTASSSLTLQSTSATGTTDSIIFQTGSQATAMTIKSAGAVGIGTTSPAQKLEVNGVALIDTGLITGLIYPPADSTTAIQFDKANGTSNVMDIDTTNSRVGIGTTSPNDKLDVNGAVKVAGTGSEGCTTATMGQMRFNPTYNYMEICQ